MSKRKWTGKRKAICCLLTCTCITTGINMDFLPVSAMENSVNEKNEEEVSTQEESIIFEADQVYGTEESSEEIDTIEEESTFESKDTMTEEAERANEQKLDLEFRTLTKRLDECEVEIEGNIPVNAKLVVKKETLTKEIEEKILEKSDILKSHSQLWNDDIKMYSYDISLLVDEMEYEPYIFDEMLQVNFFMPEIEQENCLENAEVFHVGETKEVELLSVLEQTECQVSFVSDHFSQFIIVANTTYAKEKLWKYQFKGKRETLDIKSKGIYEIKLYGAQGQNTNSYEGGRGGFVRAEVELNKGDVLEFEVGGQNGYLEGGRGTQTSGGGATKVYHNGRILAVAGGGGGALVNRDGGSGGSLEHKSTTSKGMDSGKENSAGGGAGYLGGEAGHVTYHVHQGNSSKKGGCYTKEIYHAHTQQCYGIICAHSDLSWIRIFYDSEGDDYSEWVCNGCGGHFTSNTSYGPPGPQPNYGWVCRLDGKITGYELECGMTPKTIVGSQPSYGGSNYFAANCKETVSQSGMRVGNGYAQVELKKIDAASVTFENEGREYKRFYIEKGTEYTGATLDNPYKNEDARYRYRFLGWDDLQTDDEEKLTIGDIFQGKIIADRLYGAVYEKIPQKYMITFNSEGSNLCGTKNIEATYDAAMPDIAVPQKDGVIFAGYYADVKDEGTKYYDAYGKAIRYSDFTKNTVLQAKWEDPLVITKNPQDQIIISGYSGIVLSAGAELSPANGYDKQYQWYVNEKNVTSGAKEIEEGFTDKLIIPQGYKVGNYYIFCKVTATGSVNQKITKYTDMATIQVVKGNLSEDKIVLLENNRIYDGQFHSVQVKVKDDADAKIYYSTQELTKNNYKKTGSIIPPSYKDAGEYKIYIFVESESFEDFTGCVIYKINKKQLNIYLGSKNTTFQDGKQQKTDEAVIDGIYPEDKEKIEISYVYYTDKEKKNKTTKEHGAKKEGLEPSEIGTYYVTAETKETANYKSACTRQAAMLNILGGALPYSVTDYIGAFDGQLHGLKIYIEDEKKEKIYFSDSEKLTAENYLEKGTTKPYQYRNAGKYTIHYAVVSKLTDQFDHVIPGTAMIQINKAIRELGDDIPRLNPDFTLWIPENTQWEYKKNDEKDDWSIYEEGTILKPGEYLVRMPEDENYECSEPVLIVVKKQNTMQPDYGNAGTGNSQNPSENDDNNNASSGNQNNTGNKKPSVNNDIIIPDNTVWDNPHVSADKEKLQNNFFKNNIRTKEEISTEKYLLDDFDTNDNPQYVSEEKEFFEMPETKELEKKQNIKIILLKYVILGFVLGILFLELLLLLLFLFGRRKKEKKDEDQKE